MRVRTVGGDLLDGGLPPRVRLGEEHEVGVAVAHEGERGGRRRGSSISTFETSSDTARRRRLRSGASSTCLRQSRVYGKMRRAW